MSRKSQELANYQDPTAMQEWAEQYGKKPEKRHKFRKFLGYTALVTTIAAVGGYAGWVDGWADPRKPHFALSGGEQDVVKIDLNFQELCMTAATVNVTGAFAEESFKALGIIPLSRKNTVSFQAVEKFCIDPKDLSAKKDNATGDTTVNVTDASSITTDLSVVPQVGQNAIESTPSGNDLAQLAKGLNTVFQGIPLLNKTAAVEGGAAGSNNIDSQEQNAALVTGLYAVKENCTADVAAIAEKTFKQDLTEVVLMAEPNESASQVSVTVAGQNILDVDPASIGVTSNIDPQEAALEAAVKKASGIDYGAGSLGSCKVAANAVEAGE